MKTKIAFVPKLLALLLALMLILSAFPVAALEADEEPSAEVETEAEVLETEPEELEAEPTEYSDAEEGAEESGSDLDIEAPTEEEIAAPEATELPTEVIEAPTEGKGEIAGVAAPEDESVKPTAPPMEISDGYYLFGPKKGEAESYNWSDINNVKPNEKFSLNTENEDETEYMLFANLAHYRRIKVVEVVDNKIVHYYPDGLGNEYVVPSEYTGNVVIFFTPTPNTKEDWAPFGKYFYISKTLTVKNEDGSESTVPVEEDKKNPTMSACDPAYAYKDGDNMVDYDNSYWIEGSKELYYKVEAKDEGTGINENGFLLRWNDNQDQVRPKVVSGSNKNEYYLKLPGKFPVRARVEDKKGNKSNELTTDELKIDYAAPTADDVVKGVFSSPSGNLDSILNILSFGLYTNKSIAFTVYVSSHDGSPITEINLVDKNGSEISKDGGVNKVSDGFYTQKFLIDPKNDSVAEDKQPYNLKVSTVADTCYEPATVYKSFLDLDLYTDKTIDSNKLQVKNKDLYELVNTLIKPCSEITLSGDQGNGDIYTSKDKAITFSSDLSDSVSGISEKEGAVKAYVGLASKLKQREDGTYNVKAAPVHELTISASNTSHDGSGELTGKLLSETVSGPIPQEWTDKTGVYRVVTVVKNNSNNVGYEAVDFTVDNYPPEITDIKVVLAADHTKEVTDWTKEKVNVQFKSSDDSGDVTLKAAGANGDDYAVTKEGGYYYFEPDRMQKYTITATDPFGHVTTSELDADKVLFDDEKPEISEVKYDGEDYKDSPWQKKEQGVEVSFKVKDISKKVKKLWLSGGASITGSEQIKITAYDENDDKFYTETKKTADITDGSYTFTFVSYKYQAYRIVAEDFAGNSVEYSNANEKTKVDHYKPEVTNITFESEPANDGAKILNFLTFGLYSDDVITMTVEAEDKGDTANWEASSGIADIVAYDESGEPLEAEAMEGGVFKDGATTTAKRKFKFTFDRIYDGSNINVKVVDNAGYNNGDKGQSLYALKDKVTAPITLDLSKYFDIVGSQKTADIDEKALEYKKKSTDDPLHSYEGRWYPGDVIHVFSAEDNVTKIHSVKVELNGADITSACTDGSGNIPEEYTHWNKDDSGKKLETLNFSYDSSVSAISENLHRTSDNDEYGGKNEVTVTVVSNNGCSDFITPNPYYIDNTIPVIEGFDFEGYSTDKPTGGAVLKTTYGYYFKNSTNVTVTASDVGSGVNNIHLYGIAATAEHGTVDFSDTKIETDEQAVFTIPANFKGQLVAYAYDNVNNRSLDYNPDGLIVESEGTHPNVSGSKITINTNPVGSDQDGVKLFSGDVSVSFDIYDMYSGLKEVSYRIVDTAHPNPEYITINTNDTPVNAAYVGDWRIDNIQSNLAHRISKTITVSAQEHNDNGVKIQLKGVDRAGFEIPQIEETVSIDITKPIIKVEYNPVLSAAAAHNGENYFKVDRTATITITERNFNPDQIDWSKFVAIEGSRPAVVGTSNWSSSYALETGSAVSPEQRTAVHTAQITFAEDGKFDVDFDYTDLAGNAADKQFEKETFYIDKTKPVMTVEMKYSSSPRYSQDNLATIRIVEHNFDPDAEHLTYTPTATGPDYTGSGVTPAISGWSTSGDEHTATISFPDEGKYTFKLTFKDLALNDADEHDEPEFYVDHTAEKPEFDETKIKEHFAYDGVVTPAINYHDNSFNSGNYSFKLTRHAFDFSKGDHGEQITEVVKYPAANVITKNSATGLDNGARVDYENFPNQEIADGIYTLYAEYTDLANNKAENSITFSVNRFGSVFTLANPVTTSLVDKGYTNDAPNVAIREISAIQHKSSSVTLSYNSSSRKLDAKQYSVNTPSDVGKWCEYIYEVFDDNFKNEGEYTVTVTSQYSVGGKDKEISNRTANTDGEVERNCPVSFVVDKTNPAVSISGVEDGQFYSEAEKNLKIVCTDDNIDKSSLIVKLDDAPIDLAAYGSKVKDDLFGEIDIDLPIAADGKQTQHSIAVEVKDLAGNGSDNAVNAFTLSATFLTMFFHNTVALIVSGAVLAALVGLGIFLVIRKRKKV